jgi:hypothetical protein
MKKVSYIFLSLTFCICTVLITKAGDTNTPTKKQKSTKSLSLNPWEEMGPDNISGRTNCILVDKNNHSKIYAGSAGGGLWVSTSNGAVWERITSIPQLAISSIVQTDDGTIFVGTGEGLNPNFTSPGVLYNIGVYGHAANFGMKGNGIYKSVNDSFVQLPATNEWEEINDLAYNSTTKTLYAATDYGLQVSKDNGNTWTIAKTSSNQELDLVGVDLAIASDNSVIYVQRNRTNDVGMAYISDGKNTNNFEELDLPSESGSITVAFAPSDPNYIYASIANTMGEFLGIYQSKNKGKDFRTIVPGGSILIDVFNNGGDYCNNIAVFPNNPKRILVGGNPFLWEGIEISEDTYFSFDSKFNLSGVQSIYFNPYDTNTIFVGCNIGNIKIIYEGETYSLNIYNKNYATTQFSTVSFSNDDKVLGGTRESGALYITKEENTKKSAIQLTSGFASHTALSMINTNALFYTTSYGTCYRQASILSDPEEIKDWYNAELMLGGTNNENTKWSYAALKKACRSSQYISPILMWESTHDPNSTDTVVFVADKNYKIGDEICVRSVTNNYPMRETAPRALTKGEKITFTDYVQNRLFIGGGGFISSGLIGAPVFMTKNALNFITPPVWYRVFFTGDTTEQVTNMCVSEDGNHLFISTFSGSTTYHSIYRISGFNLARDSMTLSYGKPSSSGIVNLNPNCLLDVAKVYSTNSYITSITLDPQNTDVLIMTIGGNNLEPHIYASTNATTDTLLDFNSNSKEGTGLPSGKTPIYTALVEMNNSNLVFVGTEKGIYATENFSSSNPTWAPVNNGIDVEIPVFMLKQQTKHYPDERAIIYGDDSTDITYIDFKGVKNTGYIYAATHGRGIFKNTTYYIPPASINEHKNSNKPYLLNIYPNPANDNASINYNLNKPADNLKLSFYDITGKMILSNDLGSRHKGDNTENIDLNSLPNGIYIVRLQGNNQIFNGKIVVTK